MRGRSWAWTFAASRFMSCGSRRLRRSAGMAPPGDGSPITTIAAAAASHWLLGFPWPVGFVLGPELLVTVRFEELNAFTTFGKAAPETASEAFAGLVEAIVDRIADVLERIAAELDTLSRRLFRSGTLQGGGRHRPAHGGNVGIEGLEVERLPSGA